MNKKINEATKMRTVFNLHVYIYEELQLKYYYNAYIRVKMQTRKILEDLWESRTDDID